MSVMEIVLLAAGGIVFILSFMIPARKEESSEETRELAKDEIKTLVSEELEAVRGHVDDVVEEAVTYSIEKTERSLERLSNEKIMAVNEYSDTVLAEIHKNHEEVMFLYDMLNDKHTNLKNTVSEINRTVKEAKETKKEAEEVVNTFQRLAPETVSPLKANGMSMPQAAASQQVFATAPHVAVPVNVVQQRVIAQQKINTQQRADMSPDLNTPQGTDARQRVNMPRASAASQMAATAPRAAAQASKAAEASKVPAAQQFVTASQGAAASRKAAAGAPDIKAQRPAGVQESAAVLPSAVQQPSVMGQEIMAASSDTASKLPAGGREAAAPVPDGLSRAPVMGQEMTVPVSDTMPQLSGMEQEITPVSGMMQQNSAVGPEVTVPVPDTAPQNSAVVPEITAPVSEAAPQASVMGPEVTVPVSDILPQTSSMEPPVPMASEVPMVPDVLSQNSAMVPEITVPEADAAPQFSAAGQGAAMPMTGTALQAPGVMQKVLAQDAVSEPLVMRQEASAFGPDAAPQAPVMTQEIPAQAPPVTSQVPVMAQERVTGVHDVVQGEAVPPVFATAPIPGMGQMPVAPQPVSSVPQTVTAPQQEYAVPPVFATAPMPMTAQMPVMQQPYTAQQSFTEPVPGSGSPLPPGSISFTQETDGQGRNYNDRILEMYKEGKSKVVIARELNLGVGEVKLVIDLYKNRSEKVK